MSEGWRDAYRGRCVLVTGATGFIGWHVARTLHDLGAEVLSVVRHAGGPAAEGGAVPGIPMLVDLEHPGAVARLVHDRAPAICFNLAGYGVDPSERQVPLAERLNTELPEELVAALGALPSGDWTGQQLVHAGSALEYGTAPGDLREGTPPQPTTLYGTTKAAGTAAALGRAAASGVRATVARLFTVYGPREHPGRLLPTLLRAARGDGPILLTAGAQRRDFTWVGDVVEGMLRLGVTREREPSVVNLATGELTSVREFVERAARVLGIAPERLHFGAQPTRAEEMVHDAVAIGRLVARTAWRPATTIEAGVGLTASA